MQKHMYEYTKLERNIHKIKRKRDNTTIKRRRRTREKNADASSLVMGTDELSLYA